MSWYCSRALAAEYSAAGCSGIGSSAPLKSTGTDGASSPPARTTAPCPHSPFGTTSEHSTDCLGAGELTWYLAGFPAKPIPPRLEAGTLRMISGRKCGESWQRSLPGTYLPRTSHAQPLTPPQTTLRRWVTRPAALPYQRGTWVLTTFGSGTGYVHTPTATANYAAPSMQKWRGCREFVRVFGTPSPENHEWLMGWPNGWTALQPLATDKWLSWLRQHSL